MGVGGLGCVKVGSVDGGLGWFELELGLGKMRGGEEREWQESESAEHLWVFWRPCRKTPNPKTSPRTTSTVTTKMKIFVAFPT